MYIVARYEEKPSLKLQAKKKQFRAKTAKNVLYFGFFRAKLAFLRLSLEVGFSSYPVTMLPPCRREKGREKRWTLQYTVNIKILFYKMKWNIQKFMGNFRNLQ